MVGHPEYVFVTYIVICGCEIMRNFQFLTWSRTACVVWKHCFAMIDDDVVYVVQCMEL